MSPIKAHRGCHRRVIRCVLINTQGFTRPTQDLAQPHLFPCVMKESGNEHNTFASIKKWHMSKGAVALNICTTVIHNRVDIRNRKQGCRGTSTTTFRKKY